MEISETIKFRDICNMLTRIQKQPKPKNKSKVIEQYYDSFCKHRLKFREEQQLQPEDPEEGRSSFYCILRCIIPAADHISSRPPYGLQIPKLAKAFIKILQLSRDSRDAEILEARNFSGIKGDYGEIVYRVLKPRCSNDKSNLTLKEIHDMLDSIAVENLQNTEMVLTKLSEVASAEEQMWFVRLLLKSMHLGIGEQSIFGLLHQHAKSFFQSCGNLSKLCCHLADDSFNVIVQQRSNAAGASTSTTASLLVTITVFEHIRPQLCEMFPGHIENIMAADVLYMETKMDGERFQLHCKDNEFKYISRNSIDYTKGFGSSFEAEGNMLTKKLKHLLPIGMKNMILDGEMMVFDAYNNKYRDKGENVDVKHLPSDRGLQACFVVYDILYYNDQSYLDVPYIQRQHKLGNLLKEQEGVLQIMKTVKITSVEQFKNLFQQALDNHQEGVVLKKQNAVYRPGARNGSGWYKVKADYIDGLTTEFDLIVMGGFYNRQRTYVESFLLGVLKYVSDQQYEVHSVGKVSNNIQQRLVLVNHLKAHWHLLSQEQPPIWYKYVHQNPEGRPDVWIDPRHSVILQVKATELSPSSAFALTISLRFPRIQAWRNDKTWQECFSLEEFNLIKQNRRGTGVKKIVKRTVDMEDFTTDRAKRIKVTPAMKRNMAVQSYEKRFDPSMVDKKSDLLDTFKVCILSASLSNGYTPEYLKTLAVENGAEIVENPLPNNPNCIIITGDMTYRAEMLMKTKKYDIVSMQWLLSVCEKQQMKLRPRDMLCMTERMQETFAEYYDEYGDHYTELLSHKELKRIFEYLQKTEMHIPELEDSAILQLETEIYGSSFNTNYFRAKYGYFYSIDVDSMTAKLRFEWHGGSLLSDREYSNNTERFKQINYIFINIVQLERNKFMEWLKERFYDSMLSKIQIIDIQWINESHKARMLADIKEFSWHDF